MDVLRCVKSGSYLIPDPFKQRKLNLRSIMKMSAADNMTDVIRRSLAVYEHLWKAKGAGATVVIRKHDDREQDLFLL